MRRTKGERKKERKKASEKGKKGHGKKEKRDKDVFRMCWNLKFGEGKRRGKRRSHRGQRRLERVRVVGKHVFLRRSDNQEEGGSRRTEYQRKGSAKAAGADET